MTILISISRPDSAKQQQFSKHMITNYARNENTLSEKTPASLQLYQFLVSITVLYGDFP